MFLHGIVLYLWTLLQVTTITDDDQFLLLGCDGLFDVYSPLEVVNFVKEQMLEHGDAQKCCQVCYSVCALMRTTLVNVYARFKFSLLHTCIFFIDVYICT